MGAHGVWPRSIASWRMRTAAGSALAFLFGACGAPGPAYPPAWELGGQTQAYHEGPYVMAGDAGPRSHLRTLIEHAPLRTDEQGTEPVASFEPQDLGWERWELRAQTGTSPGSTTWCWRPQRAKAESAQPMVQAVIVLCYQPGERTERVVRWGMEAWSHAVRALRLTPPSPHVLVSDAPAFEVLMDCVLRGWRVEACIVVTDEESGPPTLVRGPDPLAPLVRDAAFPLAGYPETPLKGHGLALLARMALVDMGLEGRPWQSEERAYDGWKDAEAAVFHGIATVRFEVGETELDLTQSDRPELGEDERQALVVWSLVQSLGAPRAGELDRYLGSLKLETRLRHNQDPKRLEAWKEWLREARLWLRALTLQVQDAPPKPRPRPESEETDPDTAALFEELEAESGD